MKNIIYILISFCLFINCKKETNRSILDGKIKTLEWYDSTNTLIASYSFNYDSTGELANVTNKNQTYITFHDRTSNSIRMNYYETNNVEYRKIYIDSNNKITGILKFDTITSTDGFEIYRFKYNGLVLDSTFEDYTPEIVGPPIMGTINLISEYDGNNYLKFYSKWGGQWPPIIGSYVEFNDTIQYEYTSIINDGQVPMQFLLRNYQWNTDNWETFPLGANTLYMLGINGIGVKLNKNLIKKINISSMENYTINFEYTLNTDNKVSEMKVTDRLYGETFRYSFKMSYN